MSIPLSDLGQALATFYYDDLAQWSSFETVAFAEDLSASFGLADDILRMEEEWVSFAALIHTLQADLIPQDLLATATDGPVSPSEQQDPLALYGGEAKAYPFTSTASPIFTGTSADLPVRKGGRENANKTADQPNTSTLNHAWDSPGHLPSLSRETNNGDPGFELHERSAPPESFVDPPALNTELLTPLSGKVPGQLPGRELTGLKYWVSPESTPSGSAAVSPEVPLTPSDSIWSQPLNNLGDLAMFTRHSNTEHGAMESLDASLQTSGSGVYAPEQTEPRERSGNEFPGLPATLPVQDLPIQRTYLVQAYGRHEYLPSPPGAITPAPFPEQETLSNIPDTDDLLDALTERILRDFRRYYP